MEAENGWMKITLLGTGTPVPSSRRMSAGYMVEVDGDLILFDHGPGCFQRLLEAGKWPTEVSHLFLTHLHYDHCLDYVRLLLTRWDQSDGSVPELRVVGPAGTAVMTERLIGPEGAFAGDLEARTGHELSLQTYELRGGVLPRRRPAPEVAELASGGTYEGAGWRVRAVGVPHVQPYLECLGYRLDAACGSFAFSGDCGPSNAFARLAEGVDVMVHMCHYVSGTVQGAAWERTVAGHLEVARVAAEAGAKTLVASHIASQMDAAGMKERLTAEMASIYDGSIIWGEDLMTVPAVGVAPADHVG
jgi:ribonuclease BN (tRNA processing enzyme)